MSEQLQKSSQQANPVSAPRQKEARHWQQFWALQPDITYLNHGSFGACPLAVLEVQQQLRLQLERQPMDFLSRELEPLLDDARQKLAAFVGAPAEDVAFVPNATTGVNAVLRSLSLSSIPSARLQVGDQIVTTSHTYNACRNALDYVASYARLEIIVADVPFPLESPQQVTTTVMNCVTPRTKLALLDHVTSQTGLIFPLAELISLLRSRGIDTLIDGAHAPGMIPLDLEALGATYYTGNCHKWLCAPKGAAFLYVQRDRQAAIRPLTISHGANSPRRPEVAAPQDARSQFLLEFDWMGTTDPTPYLSIPTAIEFIDNCLSGGWRAVMAHNRAMTLTARHLLCKTLGVPLPCPNEMIGTLASVPMPDAPDCSLQEKLRAEFKIEVPVFPWPCPPKRLLRISAHLYNTPADYKVLTDVLSQLDLAS
jgi:isopenicillin-N epimerase